MVTIRGNNVNVAVEQQGIDVLPSGPGVNVYVLMGHPGPEGPQGPAGPAGDRYEVLEGTSATFEVGTVIEFITIEPHELQRTVLIGTTAGGSDIAAEVIAANQAGIIRLDLYTAEETELHFTGSPLNAKIYRALP